MDSRPIGVFDSGFGGLTVLSELKKKLPHENFIYFGDTLRVPYGNKPTEDIILYSDQVSQWLVAQNVKAIVVACNTSSCIALPHLQKQFTVPLFGMIDAGVTTIMHSLKTKNGLGEKFGIIGTKNTISSGVHEVVLRQAGFCGEIFGEACGLFVPTLEEGVMDETVWNTLITYYLSNMRKQKISGVLLACTHYPIVVAYLEKFFGTKTKILNPNTFLVPQVVDYLQRNQLENLQPAEGRVKVCITGSIVSFSSFYHQFFDFASDDITVIYLSAIQ